MNDATSATDPTVEKFIDHWSKSSGAERANFQSFAKDLCKLLEVPEPDPARGDPSLDIYTFEYGVKFKAADGSESPALTNVFAADERRIADDKFDVMALHLGLGKRAGLDRHIQPYRNGRGK